MESIFFKDYFLCLGEAILRLSEAITHPDVEKNEFIQDASIQRFDCVIEIFWKTLKKVLAYEKIDTSTPRNVLELAFQYNLIDDESAWLKMLDDRNNTSHVYKKEDAKRVFENIKIYLPVFKKTYAFLQNKYNL